MTKYDFETIIERRGTGSLKWDARSRRGHAADELPLWVADMDFKTVPAAIEACSATQWRPTDTTRRCKGGSSAVTAGAPRVSGSS